MPTVTVQDIVFIQGEEADDILETIQNGGREQGVAYLQRWDYGDDGEETTGDPYNSNDYVYYSEDGQYVMYWSWNMQYVGLSRIVH